MLLDMLPWTGGGESLTEKLDSLKKWLNALCDSINDCLCGLDAGNLSEELYSTLTTTKVVANTVISNTVITQNLYATYGDIAELTVDRLLTVNKVAKYKARDTSEINYIHIQDKSISFITGTTTGASEQHKDRSGNLLWWRDAEELSMGTETTAYPVTVYSYTEQIKASISYVMDTNTGFYMPKISLGIGNGNGDNAKAFIYKGTKGLCFDYYSNSGELRSIELNDKGIAMTPYQLDSIDFTAVGFTAVYSGENISYSWEKDASGRITRLISAAGDIVPISWN